MQYRRRARRREAGVEMKWTKIITIICIAGKKFKKKHFFLKKSEITFSVERKGGPFLKEKKKKKIL